jgi:hypothetical protein
LQTFKTIKFTSKNFLNIKELQLKERCNDVMVQKSAGPKFNRHVISLSRKYVIKTIKQQKNNKEVAARQQEWPPSACPKCSYWTSTSLNYKNSGRQKRNCKVSQSFNGI